MEPQPISLIEAMIRRKKRAAQKTTIAIETEEENKLEPTDKIVGDPIQEPIQPKMMSRPHTMVSNVEFRQQLGSFSKKRPLEDSTDPALKYDDDEPIDETIKQTPEKESVKKDPSTLNPDESFTISLKIKHKVLQLNSASATVEPLLFTINALPDNDEKKVPLDLICVLDTSGSMEGSKIMLLIETLKYLVDLLGENDRISIVKFSSRGARLLPLKRVSEVNKPEILKVINSLVASGGTDITDGMRHAVRIINERKFRNPVTSVFLLSDGLDEKAVYGVGELLNTQQPKDNFTIYSFGYGSDHDPNLMSTIAKYKDGTFYFVEKLETVHESFVDALGALIAIVGQDITITIQGVQSDIFPNLEIKKAFGGADLWKTIDGTYSTGISQLPSDKSKNYVLELVIPKSSKSLTDQQREVILAKALVTVRIPNTTTVWKKECELKVDLLNEEEELPPQVADKDVLNNYYRVRSAEIMMEAKKFAENANYDEGEKILQNFKEELSNSAVKDEDMVVGLLEDIEITIGEMKPKIYEAVGKHRLEQQVTSHMKERSNPYAASSFNMYGTYRQKKMVLNARFGNTFAE